MGFRGVRKRTARGIEKRTKARRARNGDAITENGGRCGKVMLGKGMLWPGSPGIKNPRACSWGKEWEGAVVFALLLFFSPRWNCESDRRVMRDWRVIRSQYEGGPGNNSTWDEVKEKQHHQATAPPLHRPSLFGEFFLGRRSSYLIDSAGHSPRPLGDCDCPILKQPGSAQSFFTPSVGAWERGSVASSPMVRPWPRSRCTIRWCGPKNLTRPR